MKHALWHIPKNAVKVFSGKIHSVWQWEQQLYDGSTTTFEGLSRNNDAATVIGVLPDGRIMLVHDEQPERAKVITAAGGRIEPGETPEQAAHREFLEETGYGITTLIPWRRFQPYPRVQWTIHTFIGRDVYKVQKQNTEPGEKISVLFFSFEEFLKLGFDSTVRDPYLRIRLLEAYYDPQKKDTLKQELYGT